MAIQHTDTDFHDLSFFSDSYEDIIITSASDFANKKSAYGNLYTFSGKVDFSSAEYIKYFLMQGDIVKDTKQINIINNGKNGETGDTGITITLSPSNINLTPNRSGAVADTVTTLVQFNASQNNSASTIKSITLLNSISTDYVEITKLTDTSKINVTVKSGFLFSSAQDTNYNLNFTVVTSDNSSAEVALTLNKVSKGASLGRVAGVPSGRVIQNVKYDKDDGTGVVKENTGTVYAFVNDIIVNVGDFTNPTIADVYRFNGSDWIKINDDVNACYAAFDDIMATANSSLAQVICKRLVAQTALINNLITKFVKIKDGGYIRSGAFIGSDGSDVDNPTSGNGVLIKSDGTTNIRGALTASSLTINDGANVSGLGISNVTNLQSALDKDVVNYQKVYYKIKKSDFTAYPTPHNSYVTSTSTTEKTWTKTRPTPTDDCYIFSCTQTQTNAQVAAKTVTNTTVTIDTETVIDTTSGYIRTNLIDANDVLAQTVTMKDKSVIKTEGYDPTASTQPDSGYMLDGKSGKIYCNNLIANGGSFNGNVITPEINMDKDVGMPTIELIQRYNDYTNFNINLIDESYLSIKKKLDNLLDNTNSKAINVNYDDSTQKRIYIHIVSNDPNNVLISSGLKHCYYLQRYKEYGKDYYNYTISSIGIPGHSSRTILTSNGTKYSSDIYSNKLSFVYISEELSVNAKTLYSGNIIESRSGYKFNDALWVINNNDSHGYTHGDYWNLCKMLNIDSPRLCCVKRGSGNYELAVVYKEGSNYILNIAGVQYFTFIENNETSTGITDFKL